MASSNKGSTRQGRKHEWSSMRISQNKREYNLISQENKLNEKKVQVLAWPYFFFMKDFESIRDNLLKTAV